MKRIIQGLVLATLVSTAQASPFPGNGDPVSLPARSTYAEARAGQADRWVGSAIPGNGDPVSLAARSTYASAHTGQPSTMVGSAFPTDGDGELIALPARSTYSDRFATDGVKQAGVASEEAALSE